MVNDIKVNVKDKFKRLGGEEALKCDDCMIDQIQTQSHCLVCPHWEDIRRGLELDQMEGLDTLLERARAKNGSH